jgi:glycerol-3-phosphate dehydrogenase (NAD(P)+)
MEATANSGPSTLIVGAGALGSALGTVLSRKGLSLALWDKDPGRPSLGKTLQELIPDAKTILFCVPSFAVRSVAETAAKSMQNDAIVICFAKGLEEGTMKTMDQVLMETLPQGVHFALVGGPMLAGEMSAGSRSIGVIASTDTVALTAAQNLFGGTNVRVSMTNDVRGVALSGVLKNIYAVSFGLASGFGMSGNEKGWLAAQATKEMVGIAVMLGGKEETVMGSAGLADLLATGGSSASRNRQSGVELAQDIIPEIKGEGIVSLPAVLSLLGTNRNHFPLLDTLARIAIDHTPSKEAFDQYVQANP